MSLSRNLWQENQDLAKASLQHPFVQGIRNGTLPTDSFQRYLDQDIPFMKATIRVYSLILSRVDEDGMYSMFNLLSGAFDELKTQQAKQLPGQKSKLLPAAKNYIEFMSAQSTMDDIGYALAAITPCVRLYAYLGQFLLNETKLEPKHAYSDWIEAYGDPSVETMAVQLEELLDRHAISDVSEVYREAMLLEIEFFTAVM